MGKLCRRLFDSGIMAVLEESERFSKWIHGKRNDWNMSFPNDGLVAISATWEAAMIKLLMRALPATICFHPLPVSLVPSWEPSLKFANRFELSFNVWCKNVQMERCLMSESGLFYVWAFLSDFPFQSHFVGPGSRSRRKCNYKTREWAKPGRTA